MFAFDGSMKGRIGGAEKIAAASASVFLARGDGPFGKWVGGVKAPVAPSVAGGVGWLEKRQMGGFPNSFNRGDK